jgi:hypothetical protein
VRIPKYILHQAKSNVTKVTTFLKHLIKDQKRQRLPR